MPSSAYEDVIFFWIVIIIIITRFVPSTPLLVLCVTFARLVFLSWTPDDCDDDGDDDDDGGGDDDDDHVDCYFCCWLNA